MKPTLTITRMIDKCHVELCHMDVMQEHNKDIMRSMKREMMGEHQDYFKRTKGMFRLTLEFIPETKKQPEWVKKATER